MVYDPTADPVTVGVAGVCGGMAFTIYHLHEGGIDVVAAEQRGYGDTLGSTLWTDDLFTDWSDGGVYDGAGGVALRGSVHLLAPDRKRRDTGLIVNCEG